jgi:sodium-dependent dicarboxylate transporter 2/3/5
MSQSIQNAPNKSFFIRNNYHHYCIALILFVALPLGLQPVNGLTELGVMTITVLVCTLYLLAALNTLSVIFLLAPLMVLTGVTSGDSVATRFLAHSAIILVLTFSMICSNLASQGIVDKVATWFITRPIVRGKPYMFLTMFIFSKLIVGIFMENLTVSVLYIALAVAICEKIGAKKGDSLYFAIMLSTAWAGGVISVASPIAKILPNLMIGILQAQLGIVVSYAQWLAIGVPFSIVSLFAILLVTRFAVRPDMTPLKEMNPEVFANEETSMRMSKSAKISVITMLVLVALMVLPDLFLALGIMVTISQYLQSLPNTVLAMLSIFFLCFVQSEGAPVMDFTDCVKKIPLPLMFFQGTLFLISGALGSPDTGIVTWLNNLLTPFIAGLPVFGVFAGLLVATMFVTQFMSNSVTFMLVFNIGIAMLVGTGFNMGALGIMISFMSSSVAFMFPASSVGMPLWFGPGHLTVGKSALPNICMIVVLALITIALVPLALAIVPM